MAYLLIRKAWLTARIVLLEAEIALRGRLRQIGYRLRPEREFEDIIARVIAEEKLRA